MALTAKLRVDRCRELIGGLSIDTNLFVPRIAQLTKGLRLCKWEFERRSVSLQHLSSTIVDVTCSGNVHA